MMDDADRSVVDKALERVERRSARRVALLEAALMVALAVGALLLLSGCESRTVKVERPDGTLVTYHRASIFAESNSDGLSMVRDGEDVALEVGPTGSKTDAELLLEAIKLGAGLGPVPVP